jgi:AmiR/NasT family two-component response regulator
MDQGTYRNHLSATQGDPRLRETSRVVIHQAMRLLTATHGVTEASAYSIMVQASVDTRTTVRETATRIVAELTPLPAD